VVGWLSDDLWRHRNAFGTYDFALARYNPDGSLDTSFGAGGTVTTDFGDSYDWAYAVALQPDRMIVVGGYANGGLVAVDFSGREDRVHAVAVQPDGKMVAVGASEADFTLARSVVAGGFARSGP
jgi:uncharacterized delta-60 repeat protein